MEMIRVERVSKRFLIVLSAPFVYLLTTRRLGVDAHG
jgi:hypothetical protein